MAQSKVAIRLGTEGKEQIVRDFKEVGDAGDAAANRAARSFEQASRDMESCQRRQAAAQAKLVALSPAGMGLSSERAGPSTALFTAYRREQAMLEQQALALRAAIDPVWAAQQRFNVEIGSARTLVQAGKISLDEYCTALRMEQALLDQVSVGHGRGTVSAGQYKAGVQQLGFQMQDLGVQMAMAAGSGNVVKGVMTGLAMQGPQVVSAIALMRGSAGGFIGFLAGPWGAALMAATSVLAVLGAEFLGSGDAAKKAEQSAKEFGDRQSDIANFINMTTGALKEQNRTLVLNAILTRQAQVAANEKTITESRNKVFSIAQNARRDVAGNAQSWDPDVANVQRVLDPDVQKALRAAGGDIDKLATSLANLARTSRPDLKGLVLEVTGIGGQAVLAARENKNLAQELRALKGDTSALANADAGLIEARAKLAGATSAADRAQAQYAITVRDVRAAYEASNKDAAAQKLLLEGLTSAERALNIARDTGKAARAAGAQARRDDAKATRDAARAERDLLSDLIALEQRFNPAAAAARTYREEMEKIAALTGAGKITKETAADWQANLRAQSFLPGLKDDLRPDIEADEKRAEEEDRRRKAISQMLGDLEQQNVYLDAERGLIRASNDNRDLAMAKLHVIADLRREGIDLEGADARAIMDAVAATEEKRQAVAQMTQQWAEMRQFGENFIDTVLDPTAWSDFGDMGKSVLRDLAMEMWKLAAINPLKNALFGSSLPGIGGLFSSLLGGGSSAGSDIVMGGAFTRFVGGSAIGHEYTPAGAMLVGENGPEIVQMPRGAKVMTASDTRRAMGSGGASISAPVTITIDATGADAAGLARVEAQVASLRAELPGTIVSTVSEAQDRLMLRGGGY